MHFIFWILTLACPFWVLDLTIRAVGRTPPFWIGDGMAMALILLGFGLIRHGQIALRAPKGSAKPGTPLAGFNPLLSKQDWEKSLPCLFHEMRNYSCSLLGNARLLRRESLSESTLVHLGRLERTTEKIDSIARECLEATSMSRIETLQSLDMVDLVQGCIDTHFYDRHEAFQIGIKHEVPLIPGDLEKLERVFMNLFRNAFEAGARNIQVQYAVSHPWLRITVEDDGFGASEDQIGKMFHPLFTTKKEMGGTGLGLYVVKAIVESHRGHIKAISKRRPGISVSGMVFCLEFPFSVKHRPHFLLWNSVSNTGSLEFA